MQSGAPTDSDAFSCIVGNLLPFTQGECDHAFGAEFAYSIYDKELIVGEIFVRVYNEQPTFPLEVNQLHAEGSVATDCRVLQQPLN